MPKLKTKILRLTVKYLDQFEDWDKEHRYPKTETPWVEYCCDRSWHAYNDTYGADILNPAKDSYAEFCKKFRDDDPGTLMLVNGELFETIDSTIDRFACHVNSYAPRGETYDPKDAVKFDLYNKEKSSADDLVGAEMSKLYDSVTKLGQVAKAEFHDVHYPDRVLEFMVIGSADFFDLDDETKEFMTETWYRRWYDENKKRGLVEFDYSFPSVKAVTNREQYGENVDDLMEAYESRPADQKKLSFKAWLEAPFTGA